MNRIKILIAEDTEADLEIYNDAIDDFNKSGLGHQIDKIICTNKVDALKKINDDYFDAAFIDLNLSKDLANDDGKELIEVIMAKAKYPIYIVSGQISKVDHDFNNKLISKHDKSSVNTNELLLEINKIYTSGLTKILGSKGKLESSLREIFWNHFSESKDYWINHPSLNSGQLEQVISRYTLFHLLEYFQLDDIGNTVKAFDSSEMYIKPCIKTGLFPGSIVVYRDEKYLVLTPACDITQGNCECITLIKLNELLERSDLKDLKNKINLLDAKVSGIISETEGYKNTLESNGATKDILTAFDSLLSVGISKYEKEIFVLKLTELKSTIESLPCRKIIIKFIDNYKLQYIKLMEIKTNKKNLQSLMHNYISNNNSTRYYFLPEFLDFQAKIIDFQDITTVDISQIGECSKIMDISTPFIKDIQAKFSSYYARQGSPDFDFNVISKNYTLKLLG